jgi:tetratricopeptide (TPR) repeat protein
MNLTTREQECLKALGLQYLQQNKLPECKLIFNALKSIDKTNFYYFFALAKISLIENKLLRAMRYLRLAIGIYPKYGDNNNLIEMYIEKSIINLLLYKHELANSDLRKALLLLKEQNYKQKQKILALLNYIVQTNVI